MTTDFKVGDLVRARRQFNETFNMPNKGEVGLVLAMEEEGELATVSFPTMVCVMNIEHELDRLP